MIAAFGDVEAGTTLSQSEELSALLHEALPDLDTETLQLLKKNLRNDGRIRKFFAL